MRAAYLAGAETLEVRRTEIAGPGAGEVELAVDACGICGSNLHAWRHPELSITSEDAPQPGAAGHEIAATVGDVGDGVTSVSPGQRVVVEPNLTGACLACAPCHDGDHWFCRNRRSIPAWGFSERMVVPAASLFAVPPDVPAAVATLVEPLACGVHAIRSSRLGAAGRIDGARVVVLGAGVTGLLAVAAARWLGASTVAVTARHPHQGRAAAALGADDVVDAAAGDVVDRLRAHRPQLVVEAVGGRAPTFDLALRVVGSRGEVAVVGLFDEPQRIDARRAVFRELTVSFPVTYGVRDGVHDFAIALDILAAAPDRYAALITHRMPLDEVAGAFARAADKSADVLRVVVEP